MARFVEYVTNQDTGAKLNINFDHVRTVSSATSGTIAITFSNGDTHTVFGDYSTLSAWLKKDA